MGFGDGGGAGEGGVGEGGSGLFFGGLDLGGTGIFFGGLDLGGGGLFFTMMRERLVLVPSAGKMNRGELSTRCSDTIAIIDNRLRKRIVKSEKRQKENNGRRARQAARDLFLNINYRYEMKTA